MSGICQDSNHRKGAKKDTAKLYCKTREGGDDEYGISVLSWFLLLSFVPMPWGLLMFSLQAGFFCSQAALLSYTFRDFHYGRMQ